MTSFLGHWLKFLQSLNHAALEGNSESLGVDAFAREIQMPIYDRFLFSSISVTPEYFCRCVKCAPAIATHFVAVVLLCNIVSTALQILNSPHANLNLIN